VSLKKVNTPNRIDASFRTLTAHPLDRGPRSATMPAGGLIP
jgi:hypothetical protein